VNSWCKLGPKRLTKYEKVKIVTIRALQLAKGAPPLLKDIPPYLRSPIEIAERELEAGVLPIVVERATKGGRVCRIKVKELLGHSGKS